MNAATATASAAACLCLLATPAAATPGMLDRCAPRVEMLAQLARIHDERPLDWRLVPSGMLVEFLASVDGTWTIIGTFPARNSCILWSGVGARIPAVVAL